MADRATVVVAVAMSVISSQGVGGGVGCRSEKQSRKRI